MRDEQINFTYQHYIVELINEIKGNSVDEEEVKTIMKAYRSITMVS